MSRMLDEAREAPQAVARQLQQDRERWRAFGEGLRRQPPSSLLTIARGSSDHAAHYAAYLIMARLGRLVTSMPMSLVTVPVGTPLRGTGLVRLLAVGAEPDLVGPTRYFRERGAVTCAFVNDPDSPLAQAAQWLFCLHAGPERSVAATKSFIAQLVVGARLVARPAGHAALPPRWKPAACLAAGRAADWSPVSSPCGRPTACSWSAAASACRWRWRPRSSSRRPAASRPRRFSAPIQHGPMALVEEGYPLLLFAPRGPAQAGLLELAAAMRERGPACCWRRRAAGQPGAGGKARCPSSTRCARSRASTPWWRRWRARAATIPTIRRT